MLLLFLLFLLLLLLLLSCLRTQSLIMTNEPDVVSIYQILIGIILWLAIQKDSFLLLLWREKKRNEEKWKSIESKRNEITNLCRWQASSLYTFGCLTFCLFYSLLISLHHPALNIYKMYIYIKIWVYYKSLWIQFSLKLKSKSYKP